MTTLAEQIKGLPPNGRIYVDAGGRGQIETVITTAQLQAMVAENERLREAAKWSIMWLTEEYKSGPAISRLQEALGDKV